MALKTHERLIVGGDSAPRGYTFNGACEYFGGISRMTMYRLIGQGELSSYHVGIRRYFTRENLDKFIGGRSE